MKNPLNRLYPTHSVHFFKLIVYPKALTKIAYRKLIIKTDAYIFLELPSNTAQSWHAVLVSLNTE